MLLVFFQYNLENRVMVFALQEAKKSRNGKAPHSSWCNYDDLNEYFWCARNLVLSLNLKFYELDSVLFLSFFFYSCICYLSSGLVIVFPWDGPCGMMVISSNQHMMRRQYFRFLTDYLVDAIIVTRFLSSIKYLLRKI